ncbi:hypothetical protein [Streptomyces sp. NBC_01602]|uniref:hypothetical protein n=1 Tax=Streptomyces sp. NBC_01602 TaxID=2975893 RepID=UPI00386B3EE6
MHRDFTLGAVPGVLWSSASGSDDAPLVLMGHGGGTHKKGQSGLALLDAFASEEKTLHANAGRHKELSRFEAHNAVRFFARHLGRAVTSPA